MKKALSVILVLALFLSIFPYSSSAANTDSSVTTEVTMYLIESEQHSLLGGSIKGSVKYQHEYDQGRPVKTTVASTGSSYPQKEIIYADNGYIKSERILKDGTVIMEQTNNDAGAPAEIHFYGGLGTSTTYIFQAGDQVIYENLNLSEDDPSAASYQYSILGTGCDIHLTPNQTAVFSYDKSGNISKVDFYEGEERVHMYFYIYDTAGTSFQVYMAQEMEIEYTDGLISSLKSQEDLISCSYTDGIINSVKYLDPYTQELKIEYNYFYLNDGYNLTDYFVQEGFFFTSVSRHYTQDGRFERQTEQLFGGLNRGISCEYDAYGNLTKYSCDLGGLDEVHTFSYIPVTFNITIPESERKSEAGLSESSLLSAMQVGDILTFGSYRQSDSQAETNPVEWLVLDVQDGKALLISRYALEYLPYHAIAENITWEGCTLRRWLNSDFLDSTFTVEEQSLILTTRVAAGKNPYYDSLSGNDTDDRIFLLSTSEAEEYFHSDNERTCRYPDGYGGTSFDGNCRWWLRTPGYDQQCAAGVGTFGSIDYVGTYVNQEYSNYVRPAIWITTSNQVENEFNSVPGFFGTTISLVKDNNTYKILPEFSDQADKFLVWDIENDSYYDESTGCWLWYNTNVTPHVWQYWYSGISSDYADFGWMEYDNSKHVWYIEVSAGNWSRVLPKYDLSGLWHIS